MVSTSLRVATTRSTSRPVTRLMSSMGKGANGLWTATTMVVVGLRDRDHAVLAGEGTGDPLGHHVEVEVEGVELDVGKARGLGQGLGDLGLAGEGELEDGLLRRAVVELLRSPDPLGLLRGQDLLALQEAHEVDGALHRGGGGNRLALRRGRGHVLGLRL